MDDKNRKEVQIIGGTRKIQQTVLILSHHMEFRCLKIHFKHPFYNKIHLLARVCIQKTSIQMKKSNKKSNRITKHQNNM